MWVYILIDRNSANDSISILIIIHTHSHSHTHGSVLQLRDSKCYATFIFITYARFSFLFSAFCFSFSVFLCLWLSRFSIYTCICPFTLFNSFFLGFFRLFSFRYIFLLYKLNLAYWLSRSKYVSFTQFVWFIDSFAFVILLYISRCVYIYISMFVLFVSLSIRLEFVISWA